MEAVYSDERKQASRKDGEKTPQWPLNNEYFRPFFKRGASCHFFRLLFREERAHQNEEQLPNVNT